MGAFSEAPETQNATTNAWTGESSQKPAAGTDEAPGITDRSANTERPSSSRRPYSDEEAAAQAGSDEKKPNPRILHQGKGVEHRSSIHLNRSQPDNSSLLDLSITRKQSLKVSVEHALKNNIIDQLPIPQAVKQKFNQAKRAAADAKRAKEEHEMAVAESVIELLASSREGKDLEVIERLLTIRVKAMRRFTLDQRLKFIKIMSYGIFPERSMIVREGHVSKAFYFILSGQVEIFKINEGKKYRLNAMNAGDSFGDRTMNLLNDKRTASVATTMESEFLIIDKADFFNITNVNDGKHIANRIAEINKIPLLSAAEGAFAEKIVAFSQFVTYEPNEPIVLEGANNYKIYFIVRGVCKCMKVVPFHKKHLGTNYESGDKTMLVPYDPTTQPSNKHLDIVETLLAIQDMITGDYFPPLPNLLGELYSVRSIDKDKYIKLLEVEDPSKDTHTLRCSVVATTKIEILSINVVEFVRYAPESMLYEMLQQDHVFNVPIAQLQEVYLGKVNWDKYRKKISDEVTGRRVGKK
eukprot:jgi/Hompol1/5092/HPOL_000488-RA